MSNNHLLIWFQVVWFTVQPERKVTENSEIVF